MRPQFAPGMFGQDAIAESLMSDSFTEVATQGFLSRLMGSFIGLLVGPLLVIAAIILLSWNEARAVEAIRGLSEAATKAVEMSNTAPAPGNDNKLVHVIGAATATTPIADPDMNLAFTGQVAVKRDAEMYQWTETEHSSSQNNSGGSQTTRTTYTYALNWEDHAIDSSRFRHPDGHTNPAMPFGAARYAASDAKLGGYSLDATTLALIDPPQVLTPTPPAGWVANAGMLYRGDPAAPKAGDMRVGYHGLASGATLSVLADQSHGGFAPYVTSNGYQIQLAEVGNRPAGVMLADKRSSESLLTWILRAVGGALIFIGLTMFLNPLSTFASVLPFLGSIVRGAAAAVSFVIALPLTLVVIALSWLAFRPLIGGGLLVVAAGALYGLWRWHHGRTAKVSPVAAP